MGKLALIEEVTVRLQRGDDPRGFERQLGRFLKDPGIVDRVERREPAGGGPYRGSAAPIAEAAPGDLRTAQAKVLWDKGFGRELEIASFEAYLETIPAIPAFPEAWKKRFDRVILVDARVRLTRACKLAGFKYGGSDATFKDHTSVPARPEVYWLSCQDGRRNRGKAPFVCRDGFPKDERALVAVEGVALYAQDPTVIHGHYVDLPGSVHADGAWNVAFLGHWVDVPLLNWDRGGTPDAVCGSASAGVER